MNDAPPARGRLRFGEKLAVGVGTLPVFFSQAMVKSMAVSVYQMFLGVNPASLGLVLALPRVWDAFVDPLVGNISDNFRSRFGRRKPFILIGGLLMAASYGLLWMVSPHWSEHGKLGWLLAVSILFYTCSAIYSVPYQSLTFELSPDYDERTQVMAHSTFWYKVGEFVYQWAFPLSQLAFFATPLGGVRAVNWFISVFIFAGVGLVPAFGGRERYFKQASAQPKTPFWPACRAALHDRALLILIALTALKLFASMIGSSMDYYLLVYYMFDGNLALGSYWKGILSTAYAIMGFASIPLLSFLCRRFGKKQAVMVVYVLAIAAGVGKWFLFTAGIGWWLMLDPVLSAPILAAIGMVLPSMVADVCDEDELRHGQRREGMFGAVFMWIQKVGTSLAFLTTGVVLNWSGFENHLGGHQAPSTFFWMRALLAGTTSFTALLALVVAVFYPITRQRAEETRRRLEARRGAV